MKPGDLVGKRFRIERETAHGGMGTVYLARDTVADEPVAVKVMRRSDVLDDAIGSGRFAREIELLASLDDPRIVRYISHGTADGRLYLVEEWVDGQSLAEKLETEGLSAGESATVIAELAGALGVAHARGIVHRDVKPANVLLVNGEPDDVKVIDFGIARRADEVFHLTRTGTFVGTPGYISPEQARGAALVDPRSDVFSLGCILYECLTGRPAFAGRSLTAVRAKVLLYDPPRPADLDISPELVAVLDQMLRKDPDERPGDGAAVAAALAPYADRSEGARRVGPYVPSATDVFPVGPLTRPDGGTLDTVDGGVLVCVVMGDAGGTELDLPRLRKLMAPHDGRLELLGGTTVLVSAAPTLSPAEQVHRAARCALALRPELRGSIVLCGIATGGFGEAIERGVTVLSQESALPDAPPRGIRIDASFAALLREDGFVVELDTQGGARLLPSD